MDPALEDVRSLEEVREFVLEGYRASGDPNSKWNRRRPLRFGFEWGKLPLAVANAGPLVEHAVGLAGEDGMTLQQVRDLFDCLGKDRLDAALSFARAGEILREDREMRPNRAGRPQMKVVLRVREVR